MNDLLLIRHAQTDLAGTFCGHSNPPVNDAGHKQIRDLLARLGTQPVSTVYTSDLDRASTTARAIAQSLTLPCAPRPGLREINFGTWDGLTWNQIEQLDPAFAQDWLDNFPNLTPPQAESFHSFQARIRAEANFLLNLPHPGLIAVVTHAGVIRSILQDLCSIDENSAHTITQPFCCAIRYTHPSCCEVLP
jgi:alpha-ribazole phosphatase